MAKRMSLHGRSQTLRDVLTPELGGLEEASIAPANLDEGRKSPTRALVGSSYRKWKKPHHIVLIVFVCSLLFFLRVRSQADFESRGVSDSSIKSFLVRSTPKAARPVPVRRHENGLAYFDLSGSRAGHAEHPIMALMRNASQAWDEKVARQSRTLKEAVLEYKRRYRRNPPKGFDQWWKFAKKNGVVLIDEYDNIDQDIRPFFALDSTYLRERIDAYAHFENVDTLMVKDGKIKVLPAENNTEPMVRTTSEQLLVQECCASWLQDANITITPSDGPSVMMAAEHRQMHLEAVEKGKLLTRKEAETVVFSARHGPTWWSAHCKEGSRYRRNVMGLETGMLPTGPSFIYDHVYAMDLCRNPENQLLHGFTSWGGPDAIKLWPVFAYSRSAMHSDIRLVPLEQYHSEYLRDDPEWEEKPYSIAAWRGSTTGVLFHKWSQWHSSQRMRMYWLANNATGMRKVRFPVGANAVHEVDEEAGLLGEAYLDYKFAGDVVQCDSGDGTCDTVRKAVPFAEPMDDDDLFKYKYLLDIDGNGWSGRFHRLMTSNSLVLKSTIFPEWYSDRIQPWLHYVPVKVDYTDIFDIMSFFAGALDGSGHHDELAKKIAYAGKDWALKHWRVEDMQAYNARLFLEWARLSAYDRKSMEYTG